ncbi:MAG: fibrobacter succinogenes major paralogous domain-containing protein [Prevotellaceae bacterium]|jgi:uncharacterized protein (TIGR02145 family)|nr:fibrobacter succinogenes major paralogous domain-containing protein [Prevotellaceae bacterium]
MKKIILIIALATAAINLFSQEEKMYIMKDGAVMNEYLVSDIDSIIFYDPIDPSTVDEGVIINGVKWATRNVDEPGKFAATVESAGKFYQWNSKVAWNTTDQTVSGWNGDWNGNNATTWETSNNVCPVGFRVPTSAEQQSLLNAGSVWTTVNGVNGRVFGSGSNSLFLPAAGYRNSSNGTLNFIDGTFVDAGSNGHYWSSTQNDNYYAYVLYIYSDLVYWYYYNRNYGFSVRCVAE